MLTAQNAPVQATPWWRSFWRQVRANLLVCLLIAVLISALFKDNFWRTLVFSLCIGLSIQGLIYLGMVGFCRLRRSLGHRGPALDNGWPGWAWMAPWALLAALVGHSLGTALGGWLTSTAVNPVAWLNNPRTLFVMLTLTLGVTLAFTLHFYNEGRLAEAQLRTDAAQRLATEHQLKLLQTQLEPHMLFNSLANLRVLIGLDPARAQAMLDHMVAYLRATLSASRADTHPLAAEFERLQDYLALMAIRMGPRLQVTLDLPEDLRALPVPPLLLQPLVENCIKHGLEPKLEGGRLLVQARRDGTRLLLTVRDTGVGLANAAKTTPSADSGFGTDQVRQRLQALHGEQARFSLQAAPDADGGTLATIDLPCP